MDGIFLDINTTGNDIYGCHQNPITVGIRIVSNHFEPKAERTWLIEPEENTSPTVRKTLSITEKTVSDTVEFNKIWETNNKPRVFNLETALRSIHNILSKCSSAGLCLIGYNHLNYDLKILNEHFKALNLSEISFEHSIDIMKIAKRCLPLKDVISFTQENVGLVVDYRSYDDSKIVMSIDKIPGFEISWLYGLLVEKLMPITGVDNVDDLCTLVNSPTNSTTIDFGKYKGCDINDVKDDIRYLSWLKTTLMKDPVVNKTLIGHIDKILENED